MHPQIDSWARRLADLLIAATLLLVTLPMFLVAVVVSAASLRAWPFFSHERVGRGGQPFRLVKIRTLPPATDRYLDKYSLDFDRVPTAMRLLRRCHLDELPQLWQVLRGTMSLVGPRPEMLQLHEHFEPTFAQQRTSVKPGCTGLWQVSAHCDGLIEERPEYDRLYVLHRSLRFDLWILYRTAAMILGFGTVRLHEVPRWAYEPRLPVSLVGEPTLQPNID